VQKNTPKHLLFEDANCKSLFFLSVRSRSVLYSAFLFALVRFSVKNQSFTSDDQKKCKKKRLNQEQRPRNRTEKKVPNERVGGGLQLSGLGKRTPLG